MIEGISAVTLGTHEMPRAVGFYRALGFELLHGGEESSFTSFRAGTSYLNLIAQHRRHACSSCIAHHAAAVRISRVKLATGALSRQGRVAFPHCPSPAASISLFCV
jgi:hypothetical protein